VAHQSLRVDVPLAPSCSTLDAVRCNLGFLRRPDAALERLYRSAGPVVRLRLGPRPTALLVGPEANRFLMTAGAEELQAGPVWNDVLPYLRGSLLSTDGAEHLEQRRLLATAFREVGVVDRVDTMLAIARGAMARWPERIDAHTEMRRLSLRLTAALLLGLVLTEPAVTAYLRWQRALSAEILTPPGIPSLRRLRAHQAQRRVWSVLEAMIRRRRGEPGEDVLGWLLANGGVDPERLVVHAFTLLSAGSETTAAYLTFAVAMLAARPDLADALLAEQRERCGAGPPTAAGMRDLPLTQRFLREVERLFPPTPYIARRAMTDLEFAGRRIPRGTTVLGSISLTHRLPHVFGDPWAFDPDRFAPPRSASAPFALAGFGGGAHVCLGKALAQREAALVVHTVLNRWRLRPRAGSPAPAVRFRPFAEPARPIHLELAPRDAPVW
jgi:cytochrome P450